MRSEFRVTTCVRGKQPAPQISVYANPSRSAAEVIPYVVVIQSDLLDALATRLPCRSPARQRFASIGGQRGRAGQRSGVGHGRRAFGYLIRAEEQSMSRALFVR